MESAKHYVNRAFFDAKIRDAGHVQGNGEIAPTQGGETIALDAVAKLPEDAVAYQARTAGSGLDGVDGWIVVATGQQERATPHVGRLCVVRIKGGPTVIGRLRHGYSDGAYSVEQLWPETIIPDVRIEWTEPVLWIRPR